MLIRALLFSTVVHVLLLLGLMEGDLLLRVKPVLSSGMRVTLVNWEVMSEKVVVPASSGRAARPPGRRLASDNQPPRSAKQASVRNVLNQGDLAHDLYFIPDEKAVSADVLRQYRLDLARAARRFKPPSALVSRQTREGEVLILVSFALATDNPVVELASSNASPELEAEAVALVLMAVRSVSVPVSLRGRPFVLDLTLRYAPRDD